MFLVMKNDTEFSVNNGRTFLKTATDKRVSRDASIELNKDLEKYGAEISGLANEYAEDDGRVTVRAGDIRKAILDLNR